MADSTMSNLMDPQSEPTPEVGSNLIAVPVLHQTIENVTAKPVDCTDLTDSDKQ